MYHYFTISLDSGTVPLSNKVKNYSRIASRKYYKIEQQA